MTEGSLLFAPETDRAVIETKYGTIEIGAGSKALVEVNGENVTVLNLHDKAHGSINVRHGNTAMKLGLGHQLVLSSCAYRTDGENAIAMRNVRREVISGGLHAFGGEFSMVSALTTHPALRSLCQSKVKGHRAHLDPILKNACILSYVTARHGAYKK